MTVGRDSFPGPLVYHGGYLQYIGNGTKAALDQSGTGSVVGVIVRTSVYLCNERVGGGGQCGLNRGRGGG